MRKDRGSVSAPGVVLRDLIRKEGAKAAREMDQVLLAEVSDAGDGKDVGILIDGFAGGEVTATWATAYTPTVGQRCTVVSLKGGQSFYVVGVVDATPITGVTDHGLLDGPSLLDDDHTQYALADGSRTFNHAALGLLGADDHSQYHNDARALTWHGGLSGAHVTLPLDHGTDLTGQGDDDHTIYVLADGTRDISGTGVDFGLLIEGTIDTVPGMAVLQLSNAGGGTHDGDAWQLHHRGGTGGGELQDFAIYYKDATGPSWDEWLRFDFSTDQIVSDKGLLLDGAADTSLLIDAAAGFNGNMGIQIWNEHASGFGRIELGGKAGAYIDFKMLEATDQDARIRLYSADDLRIEGAVLRVNSEIQAEGATSTAFGIDLQGTADGDQFLRFGNERPWWFENRGTGASATLNLIDGSNKAMNFRNSADAIFFQIIGHATADSANVRFPFGSLSSPGIGFLSQTQTGMFAVGGSNPEVGIGSGGAEMFTGMNPASGNDEVRIKPAYDNSNGSDSFIRISSTGLMRRDSSARWLKENITDAYEMLVARPIPHPSKFQWVEPVGGSGRDEHDRSWFFGWIADQWLEDSPEIVMFDERKRAMNYELKSVAALIAAHTIALEEWSGKVDVRLDELEAAA